MKLPTEISPNPLVTSTVELRYNTSEDNNNWFPLIMSAFGKDFPGFKATQMVPELKRQNPQLKYAPDYILSNNDYRILCSNCVFSFENVGEYKLWGNYFPFISKSILKLFDLGLVNFVERIGVRYASVLDGTNGVAAVLKNLPTLKLENFSHKFEQYRSTIKIGDMNLGLNIADNVKAVKENKTTSGVYIDIDASYLKELKNPDEIINMIEKLHTEQKNLFFGLLKPEFIESLNPKY